jgi:hypothetical protein
MTCANWMLTILSAAILIVNIWPSWLDATANRWITIIAAILVLIIAWTTVDCKMCSAAKTPLQIPHPNLKQRKRRNKSSKLIYFLLI